MTGWPKPFILRFLKLNLHIIIILKRTFYLRELQQKKKSFPCISLLLPFLCLPFHSLYCVIYEDYIIQTCKLWRAVLLISKHDRQARPVQQNRCDPHLSRLSRRVKTCAGLIQIIQSGVGRTSTLVSAGQLREH